MSRITTPFGFASTADEVADGIDLTGRRIVVTGATSGIGVETARTLARTGAEMTLAVRNTAADITATTGNRAIGVRYLDVSDRRSVEAFVKDWDGPLHVLVHNAGVMATPGPEYTAEGWEGQSPPITWGTSPWPRDSTTASRPKAPGSSSSAPAAV